MVSATPQQHSALNGTIGPDRRAVGDARRPVDGGDRAVAPRPFDSSSRPSSRSLANGKCHGSFHPIPLPRRPLGAVRTARPAPSPLALSPWSCSWLCSWSSVWLRNRPWRTPPSTRAIRRRTPIVPVAPTAITLRFTEPLERSYSRAELYDQTGALVPDAVSRAGDDQFTMVIDVPAGLPNGTYSVLWRSLSTADGHTAQGYFAFRSAVKRMSRPSCRRRATR